MLTEIQGELRRIVGPAGVEATLEPDRANSLVRIETAEAVRRLPAGEVLELLRSVPDGAGPLALLESLDQWHGRL
jgi:hypothetical protein